MLTSSYEAPSTATAEKFSSLRRFIKKYLSTDLFNMEPVKEGYLPHIKFLNYKTIAQLNNSVL